MKLVILLGPSGSGKTTLARRIEREYGFGRLSFADPLRGMIHVLHAFDQGLHYVPEFDEETNDHLRMMDKDRKDIMPGRVPLRHAINELGEAVRRTFGEAFFANIMRNRLEDALTTRFDVVIDDMRFLPEWYMLTKFIADRRMRIDDLFILCASDMSSSNPADGEIATIAGLAETFYPAETFRADFRNLEPKELLGEPA